MASHGYSIVRGFFMHGRRQRFLLGLAIVLLIVEHFLLAITPIPPLVGLVVRLFAFLLLLPNLFLIVALAVQKSRYLTWAVLSFVAALPLFWQWPLALNLSIHQKELVDYLRSGSQAPTQLGLIRFLRADSGRRCLVTIDAPTGPTGLWYRGTDDGNWFSSTRLSKDWTYAEED